MAVTIIANVCNLVLDYGLIFGTLGLPQMGVEGAGLATAINPSGFDPYIAYWVAGSDTPDLGRVADGWTRVHLFEMPVAGLPPSLLSWGINGSLWILTPIACLATWVRARRSDEGTRQEPLVDPILNYF